jgi:hypothetical protein
MATIDILSEFNNAPNRSFVAIAVDAPRRGDRRFVGLGVGGFQLKAARVVSSGGFSWVVMVTL